MARAIGKRLVEYRWLDWPVVALLVALHVAITWSTGHFDALRTAGFATRLSLYTDMITVTGLLLGFAATALASYLAFSGDRITELRAIAGDKVLNQWMSAIGGFAAALGVLIVCKIGDRDLTSAAGVRWVAEGALSFVALRVLRLLWVFRQIVLIATSPPPERRRRDEPIGVRRSA